jgi:formamidopyrimidine-DNA glycosylase
MPELVEVEYWRSELANHCKGKRIVEAFNTDDSIVLENGLHNLKFLKKETENLEITEVSRRGKYLWWELSNGKKLVFHFAMSGRFYVNGKQTLKMKVAEGNPDPDKVLSSGEWPPPYAKCWFTLDDDTKVAYTNVRRFGRVMLVKSIDEIQ